MRKRKLSNTVIFVIGFLTANCLIKFLRKCMSRHFENVLSSFFNLNGFHREYTLRLCEIKWPQGLMFWGFRHTAANQFLQTYHKVQISTRGSRYLLHIVYSYQALFVNFHLGPISTVLLFSFLHTLPSIYWSQVLHELWSILARPLLLRMKLTKNFGNIVTEEEDQL